MENGILNGTELCVRTRLVVETVCVCVCVLETQTMEKIPQM
jgi:hypothetical protein